MNTKRWLATTWIYSLFYFPFVYWVLSCESTFNCKCLLILSYIAVYNCDNKYAHISLASKSNAGMLFVMLIINQNLHLEIAIWKFSNNGYGKYQKLCSANFGNTTENDWTDWQFSFLEPWWWHFSTLDSCLHYFFSSLDWNSRFCYSFTRVFLRLVWKISQLLVLIFGQLLIILVLTFEQDGMPTWWVANSVDPDQMPHLWHLIWVYTVCWGLSVPVHRVTTVIS